MPKRRPKLNAKVRDAFLFGYYEYYKNNDLEFVPAICRILTINRSFLNTFFKKRKLTDDNEESESTCVQAYINLAQQTIELATEWRRNGIYSGILGLNTNLTLLKLADFKSIHLCLVDHSDFSKEMIEFWSAICKVLREKKQLEHLQLFNSSYSNSFVLDLLPDKLDYVVLEDVNYPFKKQRKVINYLCIHSHKSMPDYKSILTIPARGY
ncbi:hypothetical protein M3Y97_00706500 [Aphelenchoides bicaudatus]|nr:hypothetical protein M3Y97_00706500 [Aphelenchoides bicaudatus]